MSKLKISALSLILVAMFGCNTSTKNNETNSGEAHGVVEVEAGEKIGTYSVVEDSTIVSFTAYKTSEKLPVSGKFTEISLYNIGEGKTALATMNGSKFSIQVSSLFTNDATETRDPKILKFFFGVMNNTSVISGVFNVSTNNQCSIDVTLNGKTSTIPLKYTANSDSTRFIFDGVMNLENWDALKAVASLNKACEALHTGPDGVSKTWNDVALHAEILLEQR